MILARYECEMVTSDITAGRPIDLNYILPKTIRVPRALERCFMNPRPGFPYRKLQDYGKQLTGAVVKYSVGRIRVEQSFGVPVAVIPNCVEIPEQSANLGPKEKLVIGTAARISPRKRLEDLIDAFRLVLGKLPDCELQIAGGV